MKSPLPCQSRRDSERVSDAHFSEGIHQWQPRGEARHHLSVKLTHSDIKIHIVMEATGCDIL